MRIPLVSDLHYDLPQLDWVVHVAPDFDLVVLAGDHLDITSGLSLDAQSAVILKYLGLLQAVARVAVTSGNHELSGPDPDGEQTAGTASSARPQWVWVYHWLPCESPGCWTGCCHYGDQDISDTAAGYATSHRRRRASRERHVP